MLFLRYSSTMLFFFAFALISKPPTISPNTCVNRLCARMKFWVPVVHDMTAKILSSSLLVDCVFLFPDCDSAFYESAHKFYVAVLNSHLSFGVDADLGQYREICTGFTHQQHVPSLNIILCEKLAYNSSSVALSSFYLLLFFP